MPRHLCLLLSLGLVASSGCRTDAALEKSGLVRVRLDEARLGQVYQGDRYALVIGVARFNDSEWRPLRYTAKDAGDVAHVLLDPARGGFKKVTLLTRPEDTTRARVLAELEALATQATRPNDVVLVYFSSHGTLARDARGELRRYLVSSDTVFRDVARTGLSADELEAAFEKLPSRRRLLVLATCHSGTGKSLLPPDVAAELERTKSAFLPEPLEQSSRASIVLSASDWGEAAREDDTLRNDVYTHFLLQGLDGRADRNLDGAVSATEAHDWARRLTYAFTQGRQRPAARILEVGADPVLLAGRITRPGQPELFSYSPRLEGAALKVGGQEPVILPGAVVIPEGRHQVELSKGGELLWSQTLALRPGERMDLERLLHPPPGGRRTVAVTASLLSFLDRRNRSEVLPPVVLAGATLRWDAILLDRLDLRLDISASRGRYALHLQPGGEVPFQFRALMVGAALGPAWHLGPVELSTGPRVAGLWLSRSFQLDLHQAGDHYVSVWPGWTTGAAWRLHHKIELSAHAT